MTPKDDSTDKHTNTNIGNIIIRAQDSETRRPYFDPSATVKTELSAGDLDGLHLGLLDLGLGHGGREHAVLQPGLHLLRLGVLRQAEPAEELAAAALHAVPLVVLVLLLLTALAADH